MQGYFTGESAVPIRKVSDTKEEEDIFASSSGDNEFVSSDSIDFSQYPQKIKEKEKNILK